MSRLLKLLLLQLSLIVWTLLWSGCSTVLHPDPSIPTLEANYPTAEFSADGQLFHGLGEVSIPRGEPYDSINFKVQGYYSGVIRVDSDRCEVHLARRYRGNENVLISIPGEADESCLFDITVSPTFPNQGLFLDKVYEFKGELLVKVLNHGDLWYGFSSRVRGDLEARILIPVPTEYSRARMVFRGCGTNFNEDMTVEDKTIDLSTIDLAYSVSKGRCVFEGFIKYDETKVKRVTWRIWGFDPEFSPLAEPVIIEKDGKLFVEADPSVSAISLDNAFLLNSEATFSFNKNINHILRVITVKGRSVICEYFSDKGRWWCRN